MKLFLVSSLALFACMPLAWHAEASNLTWILRPNGNCNSIPRKGVTLTTEREQSELSPLRLGLIEQAKPTLLRKFWRNCQPARCVLPLLGTQLQGAPFTFGLMDFWIFCLGWLRQDDYKRKATFNIGTVAVGLLIWKSPTLAWKRLTRWCSRMPCYSH